MAENKCPQTLALINAQVDPSKTTVDDFKIIMDTFITEYTTVANMSPANASIANAYKEMAFKNIQLQEELRKSQE